MPESWPHGYDCEVFGFNELEKSMKYSSKSDDFEHVTEWMRRSLKVNNVLNPKGNEHHIRITLDTESDYEIIKNYFMEK